MIERMPDYPPEYDGPECCVYCGKGDDCECPECPVCTEAGNPDCRESHNYQRDKYPAPPIEAFKLDAYGHLTFAVGFSDEWNDEIPELADDDPGRGDYLICVDAVALNGWVGYHVVVNTDSGGFIDTIETGVVEQSKVEDLRHLLTNQLDHVYANCAAGLTESEVKGNEEAIKRWADHVRSLGSEDKEVSR